MLTLRKALSLETFVVLVTLCLHQIVVAGEVSPRAPSRTADSSSRSHLLTGAGIGRAAAVTDTTYLLGGPDRDDGDFQDGFGLPDWEGWTGNDRTASGDRNWHIDSYNCDNLDPATPDNHAWWCGSPVYPSCGPGDPEGGYGNNYNDRLYWWGEVPDTTLAVTVTLTAQLNYDNEPGYDWLYLQYESATGPVTQATYNGADSGLSVVESFTLGSDDYVPHPTSGAPSVQLSWHFTSDGAWSDADCDYPTAGAAQIDLIGVAFDQGSGPVTIGTVEDCEDPGTAQWQVDGGTGAGDYAQVWLLLEDLDPCRTNDTPQVAFIDDGIVQPGTGGTHCSFMCYGPNGYVVNWRGIHPDPNTFLDNEIISPVLAWPAGSYDGAVFAFDVYTHNIFPATTWDVFYRWRVRSTADPSGEADWSEWRDSGYVYYGGPQYRRREHDVSSLIVTDCRFVHL
ncbi:MAG: hypothetical protein ABIF77_03325, partial [bacterium]